jgi:hypothetical protein
MRLRYSIAQCLGLVVFIAVELAALGAGSLPFALVTLSAATIGVFITRGPARAFFLGTSAAGWAYMLLAFGLGAEVRLALPTTRPIVQIYEMMSAPAPTAFQSQGEAERWLLALVDSVNRAITAGHVVIALALALAAGGIAQCAAVRRATTRAQDREETFLGL